MLGYDYGLLRIDVSVELSLPPDVGVVGWRRLHQVVDCLHAGKVAVDERLDEAVAVPAIVQCRLTGPLEEVRACRPLELEQAVAALVEGLGRHP